MSNNMATSAPISTQNQPLWPSLPKALDPLIIRYCDTQMLGRMQRVCWSWNFDLCIQAQMSSCAKFNPKMIEFLRDFHISIRRLPEKPPEEMLRKLLFHYAKDLKLKVWLLCWKQLNENAKTLLKEVEKILDDSWDKTEPRHPIERIDDRTWYRYLLTKRLSDSSYCNLLNIPNLVDRGELDPNRAEIQILIKEKRTGVSSLLTISASNFDPLLKHQIFSAWTVNKYDQRKWHYLLKKEVQAILADQDEIFEMATKKGNFSSKPPVTSETVVALHERIKQAETKYDAMITKKAPSTVDDSEDNEATTPPSPLELESVADLEALYLPLPAQKETTSLKTHVTALLIITTAFLASWAVHT